MTAADSSRGSGVAQLPLGFELPRTARDGQLALLPAPEPARPRFRPVPAQDAARPVVDLVVTGGVL